MATKGLTDDQKETAAEMIFSLWENNKSDYDSEAVADVLTALGYHEYAFEVTKWADTSDSLFEFNNSGE